MNSLRQPYQSLVVEVMFVQLFQYQLYQKKEEKKNGEKNKQGIKGKWKIFVTQSINIKFNYIRMK
jgi:hypothetical protein